jgi:hypothetical protein
MRNQKKLELLEKGWNEGEIKKAEHILDKARDHDVFFARMVFWSAMVVIIFANIIVSLILVPFLITLDSLILYLIVTVIAGTIGFLYNFLITDISHIEKKHHLWAGILVPLIALTNMIIMVTLSNRFIEDLNIQTPPHSPFLLGLVFGIAFILPYIVDRIRLRFSSRSSLS